MVPFPSKAIHDELIVFRLEIAGPSMSMIKATR